SAYQLAPTISAPFAVPNARQVSTLIVSRKKRTLPSHIAAFTPPVCRLRASCIRGRVPVEVVVHGKLGNEFGPHPPPVITSVAAGLFGVWYVTNPAPPPHQANPRMSSPPRGPLMTSETHSVLLVPSVISAIGRGRPDFPWVASPVV